MTDLASAYFLVASPFAIFPQNAELLLASDVLPALMSHRYLANYDWL